MSGRPVWAEIDLGAIRYNTATIAKLVSPAGVCAVVKAGAYGHDPVKVSTAALEGGASWLAVALVEEGAVLRQAGIDAPVLLLSEPPLAAMPEVVALHVTPTVYTLTGVEAAAKAVADTGATPLDVHVKVDTGMRRVGALPADAVAVARAVVDRPELRLQGLFTHFAVADQPGHPFTEDQAALLKGVVDKLAAAGIRPPLVHAANSAAALLGSTTGHSLVRCGIAIYGVPPSPALADRVVLRPALSLRAQVSHVKRVGAGEGISYGLCYRPERPSTIATVPVGYADGVPWRLGRAGGEVLLGGRRRPIAGSVTMDQIMVDCGDDDVAVGDEVVLLGRQGDQSLDAWEWAERAGTIAYEILCGIGPRVPKRYV
ncbi:MAG: alanine racemase [Acidimicrobiales bacterium]